MKLLYGLVMVAALGLLLDPMGVVGNQNPGGKKEAGQKDKGKKDKGKKEKEKEDNNPGENLDGVWMVTEVIEAGKKSLVDKNIKMVVKGNTFTLEAGGKTSKGTFRADPSKTPKEVSAFFEDGMGNKIQVDSIYEFKDDTMRVCGALGKTRPKEFSSTAENGYELVTYKRAQK